MPTSRTWRCGCSPCCGATWMPAASRLSWPATCCASTASCSSSPTPCRSTSPSWPCWWRPPAPTGSTWSRPSSAPCSNAPSAPGTATSSAPTTRRAPTWSAWSCRPSSSRCARSGPRPRPPPALWPTRTRAMPRLPSCGASTIACARCGCWTPPAAPATSCT